jgi:CHAT domain-containing protein
VNHQLYQRLVAPVSKFLETGGERLIIVPFGPLHAVPWASLLRPDGKPLVVDFETIVVPSAHVFTTLRNRDRLPRSRPDQGQGEKRSPQPSVRFLVLGDPETHLSTLPAARVEALAVAEFLGVEALISSEASEAAVHQGTADVVVLHLAAHGVYEREAPLFSRVQLAAGDGHDGFLHVHEIWDRLTLTETRLVVLSACETASGEPTRGDDIVGLTQAFLVAGSPTVIATLWPVDDPASAVLMTSFYRHFQSGMDAGQALRAAQLELSRQSEYVAPYFWAGFILVGDPETRWPGDHVSAGS